MQKSGTLTMYQNISQVVSKTLFNVKSIYVSVRIVDFNGMQSKREFLKEFLHFLWIGNDFVPVNKISLFFLTKSG